MGCNSFHLEYCARVARSGVFGVPDQVHTSFFLQDSSGVNRYVVLCYGYCVVFRYLS